MKYKLVRTSINQTGASLFINERTGEEKIIPMFTKNPCEEARGIQIPNYTLKWTVYSNNLLDYKLDELINDFIAKNKFLPENYVEEIVLGFPFTSGVNKRNYCFCYK